MLIIINSFSYLMRDLVTFCPPFRSVVFLVEVTDACLLKKVGRVLD
jgi:hypothetical protein